MKQLVLTITLSFIYLNLFAQSPCENGMAGEYPCNQINLLGHLSPEDLGALQHNGYYLNDLWGWTDPETGKEYALVGLVNGVAFVDVSTPTAPFYLGKLPEPETANNRISEVAEIQHGKSTWRDIKTYKNHAFIVSDLNSAHGMQVFDLTKLRGLEGTTPVTFQHDFLYDAFGSVHNIVINEATGYAFAVGFYGGNPCGGGMHIINIQDPKNPTFVSCFDADGYTHDAQCVIYEGTDTDYQGQSICFNSNEDTFTIVNVEDPSSPEMISRTGYENAQYSHQGWLTEDHRFFLMNDELDENEYGHNAKTLIWDIADLDTPVLIGSYVNNVTSIDHNLYTHNNLVFESNYYSGLRVLSTDSIASGQLRERAFFDTYPQDDAIHFGGSWSNYPYFQSGTIIVSDMNNGLFLLSLDLQEDPITTMPVDQADCTGEGYEFHVQTNGDVTYQWQVFDGQGYSNLVDDETYLGTNSATLKAEQNTFNEDLSFRCLVTNSEGQQFYTYLVDFSGDGTAPLVDFEIGPFTFGGPEPIQFTNLTENATSYLWDFGNEDTSTEENPSYLFAGEGTYEVTLTAYNDCGSSSISKTFNILTEADSDIKDLRLYPNPAQHYVNIYTVDAGRLSIYTLSGDLVKSFEKHAGIDYFRIDNLAKGSYIVQIKSDKGITSAMLIKR
ncbi:choice-of-anchor B family protein [Marinoscillum sp.]|uniref:choice-of-anchor B family protein n=1 Tax=Marinoscillum sp. TaxID=2024838 RepID=UPI003BAB7543